MAEGLDALDEILPLTPAQRGMLVEIAGGRTMPGAYVGIVSMALGGALDAVRLGSALDKVAAQSDALRASFVWEGVRSPVQLVHRGISVPMRTEDWRGLTEDAQSAALIEYVRSERLLGFDVTKAPLVRALVARLAEDRHRLVLSIHHLVCDGWSVGPLLEALWHAYDGTYLTGQMRFHEVLAWLKERDRSADEAYWRAALEGAAPAAEIESGPPDPPGGGLLDRVAAELPQALEDRLKALGRASSATPFTVLSAAWALQLRRYGSGNDVIFGQTVAGRPPHIKGVAHAIGAFVNTLPIRIRLDPAETASTLIARLQAQSVERSRHDHAALADVVGWWGGPREMPMFNSVLVSAGLSTTTATPHGFIVGEVSVIGPGNDPLVVSHVPGKPSTLEFWFDPSRHGRAGVVRLAEDFLELLDGLAAAPDRPISALRDIRAAEAPALVPKVPLVLESIEKWHIETPDAPAISFDNERISYANLWARSGRLAAALGKRGIGRGDLVPVAVPRGCDAVVAIIGVLRAGAAYVPLDLDYPADRLARIIHVCAPKLVIAGPDFSLPPGVTALPTDVADGPEDWSPPAIRPADTAYVIFTSGSEGQPKGVVITHGSLAYSNGIRTPVYGAAPRAFLLLSSLAFDSSVVGLYWTLTSGGLLVVSTPRLEQEPVAMGRLMARDGIDHLLCLPALWGTLIDALPPAALSALDTVIVAGEPVPGSLVSRQRDRAPDVRLFNEYGPTETTVWCATFDCARHDGGPIVPIGPAIPGTAIAIVDIDGRPLPDDVPGQIEIAGPGVAQGYLGDPRKTDQVFVTRPDGRKAYRTGDIGIRRPDGLLYFRGRADGQIKIRGHRVELAEIEEAARAVRPGAQVLALAVAGAGGPRLAVAIAPAEVGEMADLRVALQERLPNWMVPSMLLPLASLPRLPNGKPDRAALSDLAARRAAPSDRHDAPRGVIERTIADIWARVLEAQAIPREGNFFDLGGDSLKSIHALVEAEKRGLPMAAHDVFDHPVLADLAAHLSKQAAHAIPPGRSDEMLVRLNTQGRRPPLLMIHGSPQMLSTLAFTLGRDRPLDFLFSHHIKGAWPQRIEIGDMAEDAVKSLRSQHPVGPYHLAGYSVGALLALEVACRLRVAGEEVRGLFLLDPSWETGPPEDEGHGPSVEMALRRGRAAMSRWRSRHNPAGDPVARRLTEVAQSYRAALLRYRPRRFDGAAILVTSREHVVRHRGNAWIERCCTDLRRETLECSHLDLQRDPDALAAWTMRLAMHLREVEL